MINIVLDAMGGDHAPHAVLDGVQRCLERGKLEADQVILTGPAEVLQRELDRRGRGMASLQIQDAPDVLSGEETPIEALRRKPKNSIAVGIGLVKAGMADAFVSAGSTGVVVATAQVVLRRLAGIRKAGIAVTIHGRRGPVVMVDVGANPQPKPLHLLHYGIMGAAYFKDAFGAEHPRVGLMNIGSEEAKGNPLTKKAAQLLAESPVHFVGNVEGVDLFSGRCDVIVCDGFTGNVLLKVSEGVAEYMVGAMAELMDEAEVSAAKKQQILGALNRQVDYSEYGGALLLGVEGIVTICHGRSEGPAIANAIDFALRAVRTHVNQHIVQVAKGDVGP